MLRRVGITVLIFNWGRKGGRRGDVYTRKPVNTFIGK